MSVTDDRPAISPLLALGIAVLAISTSAILVRWSDAPNVVKALYRVSFTVVALSPLAVRDDGSVRRMGRRDALVAVTAGVVLAVHFVAWFESLDHTSVAASVTLVQAQPAFVVAGAWLLLGERVTPRAVGGIAIALVGMVGLSFGATLRAVVDPTTSAPATVTAGTQYGNLLALLAAVAVAGYYLAGRSLRRRLGVLPYVTVVYTACALTLLVVAVAEGYALFAYPLHEWVLFAAMALGPGVLGHTVVNWALGHLRSHVVSVSLLGEPVGSTILAVFLLAEVPTAGTVLSGAVILVGIYVTTSAGGVSGV